MEGRQALWGPASTEVDWEGKFPSLGSPMADDNRPTNASLTGPVSPSVTSRGGELVALIRVLDRVFIATSRYLPTGVCVPHEKPTWNSV